MTLVGVTLGGRYTLERRIGQGGSADVYRARDTRLDRIVSVKVLNDERALDGGFRDRLAKEAKAAATLTHSGIVRILDAGEAEIPVAGGSTVAHPFIVMEYVQGIELTKVIAKGPLKVAEALRIAKEVADALAFAHQKRIIHRDITPGNIMITKSGGVKVLDFGIAFTRPDTDSDATQALDIVGTPTYFSPEQASGNQGDERSDIYSLGVVLFEMLTGRVPFPEADSVTVARAHLNDFAPPPSQLNPKVPLKVDMIVERALSKSPAARYTTAAAFASDLETAYHGVTGMSIETSAPGFADFAEELAASPTARDVPDVLTTPSETSPSPGSTSTLAQIDAANSQTATPHQADDDFDAMFAPRATYSGGTSWSVEEISGLGAKNSPQRRRIFGGIAISLVTASVLALVAIWVINLAPANIFPSSGVEIPAVTNLTYEQAATKLRAAEFEPVQQDENSVTVAKDKVIRTEPAAGKKLEAGQLVTVVVSLGPKENAVPNVIGMTLADGTAQLTSVNLVAGSVTEAYHGSYPAGTIISTDPVAGTSLAEGKTVNIVVANGKVDVPDVRGLSLKDATAKLSSPAFMVPVVTAADKSCKSDAALTVGAQSVLGEAPLGTSVTIYYCAG
jgi:serine/threonine-protein kinase